MMWSVPWKKAWKLNWFKKQMAFTFILLAIILFALTRFLLFVEKREGVIINDPLLALFNPINLTWIIFSIIYAAVVSGLIYLTQHPVRLLFAVQTYILMVIIRMFAMYLLPFDYPPTMIELNDPFVQIFGTGQLLKKDLFFSGHTATLFVLFLVTEPKWLKKLFLLLTIIIAISVLLQHVHYTIDVFIAPFATYCAYRVVFLSFYNKPFHKLD